MRVALFLPAYNVESSVIGVLEGLSPRLVEAVEKIWIIDNGSSDGTAKKAAAFARAQRGIQSPIGIKLEIYRNESNYFLGGSTILALRMAIELGFDYLIVLHSDGQADPRDAERLLAECDEEEKPLVLGSRFLPTSDTARYSLARKAGNWFFIFLQQWLIGRRVYDLGSLAAFPISRIQRIPYDRLPYDMGYQPILISELLRKIPDLPVREIPIHWGEVGHSHVSIWSYGARHLGRMLQMFAGRVPLSGRDASLFRTNRLDR
jgi:glycosyltransferase involved in cell wall biosynthesis